MPVAYSKQSEALPKYAGLISRARSPVGPSPRSVFEASDALGWLNLSSSMQFWAVFVRDTDEPDALRALHLLSDVRLGMSRSHDCLQVLPLQSGDAEHVARLHSPFLLVPALEGSQVYALSYLLMSSTTKGDIWLAGADVDVLT